MIAITGASGNLGKATIGFLLKKTSPANIVAIVRDPEKMQDLPGIQVRVADYEDPASLMAALKGIKKVLQISASGFGEEAVRQERNVVNAAKAQGVQHIVYTSTVNPVSNPIFQGSQTNQETEKAILQAGLTHTFFRNSMYMETIPLFVGSALENGQIHYPAGNGKVSFVSRIDIAEALSHVLTSGDHKDAAYNITGGKAYSFDEIAALLQSEKGLPGSYTDIPTAAYRDEMLKFEMPVPEVDFYISMAESVKAGEFAHADDTLEQLLQHRRLTLPEYIKSI